MAQIMFGLVLMLAGIYFDILAFQGMKFNAKIIRDMVKSAPPFGTRTTALSFRELAPFRFRVLIWMLVMMGGMMFLSVGIALICFEIF